MPSLLTSQSDENPGNARDVADSAKEPILPVAQGRLVLREDAERQTADDKSEETGTKLGPFARTQRMDLVARLESRRARRLCTGGIERVAAITDDGGVWG